MTLRGTSYAVAAMTAGSDDASEGWEYVELARATSERGEVVLRERRPALPEGPGDPAAVIELRVNGVFVMDTLETTSELALATAALSQVEEPRTVLVGGLGLGFTAHEVLSDRRVERLVVAEVEEALVGWLRDGTVPHGPAFLADERLTVVVADVRQVVAETPSDTYDLVLLDVDNGPGFLVYDDNAEVYEPAFLRAVADALRPGGAVAIWSAAEAPGLHEALTQVFGHAAPLPLDVRLQGRDEQYWLYLAHL
jgi:spermidine synthase